MKSKHKKKRRKSCVRKKKKNRNKQERNSSKDRSSAKINDENIDVCIVGSPTQIPFTHCNSLRNNKNRNFAKLFSSQNINFQSSWALVSRVKISSTRTSKKLWATLKIEKNGEKNQTYFSLLRISKLTIISTSFLSLIHSNISNVILAHAYETLLNSHPAKITNSMAYKWRLNIILKLIYV